jgi:hypothetical protein
MSIFSTSSPYTAALVIKNGIDAGIARAFSSEPITDDELKAISAADENADPDAQFVRTIAILTATAIQRWQAEHPPAEQQQSPQRKSLPDGWYRGVWKPETDYPAGCCVTSDGTIWFCRTATRAKPGTSGDWQLMVKSAGRTR